MWYAYNNLGYLLRQGLLDEELVFRGAGFDSVDIWARYWPVIDLYRRTDLGPRMLEDFEFLVKTMWEMGRVRGRISGLTPEMYKDIFETKAAVSTSP